MDISRVPRVLWGGPGVMFKYLVMGLESEDHQMQIVRTLNYHPEVPDMDLEIVESTRGELGQAGLAPNQYRLHIHGGGSLSVNPYSKSVTVFGSSPKYGAEPHREEVARILEGLFPDYKTSWSYPAGSSETDAGAARRGPIH